MKTIEEAIAFVGRKLPPEEQAARDETVKQLMGDPSLLHMAIAIADAPGGYVQKLTFALVQGVLIGMESEKP